MIEKPISISEIYDTFKKSPDGIRLKKERRYFQYIEIIEDYMLNLPQVDKTLGADINNLEHMRLTLGITQALTRRLKLSEEESYRLEIATIIHDMPEARSKDCTFDRTNEEIKKIEFQHMKNIANHVLFPKNSEKSKFIVDIYENIVKNSNTKLGEIFNVVEKIGYLRTGINAFKGTYPMCPGDYQCYLWITHNVLMNQIPKLTEYSKAYLPVKTYLKNQKEIISEAFLECQKGFVAYLTDPYVQAGYYLEEVEEKFTKAHKAWGNFLLQQKLVYIPE